MLILLQGLLALSIVGIGVFLFDVYVTGRRLPTRRRR